MSEEESEKERVTNRMETQKERPQWQWRQEARGEAQVDLCVVAVVMWLCAAQCASMSIQAQQHTVILLLSPRSCPRRRNCRLCLGAKRVVVHVCSQFASITANRLQHRPLHAVRASVSPPSLV